MKTSKKILLIFTTLLITTATCTLSIKANSNNISIQDTEIEIRSNVSRLTDESLHYFCFLESGNVVHRHVNIRGFYISFPSCFCIGCVDLDLTESYEPNITRLTIKSISGETIYKNNISVSLKGFIGYVCQTGSVPAGVLKGFALVANVTPLEKST